MEPAGGSSSFAKSCGAPTIVSQWC
jgi:hypothetical protein